VLSHVELGLIKERFKFFSGLWGIWRTIEWNAVKNEKQRKHMLILRPAMGRFALHLIPQPIAPNSYEHPKPTSPPSLHALSSRLGAHKTAFSCHPYVPLEHLSRSGRQCDAQNE
jgi:hypothetical protein